MSSEPISGLPSGTPADSNELPQAIPTVSTQRITQSQLASYILGKLGSGFDHIVTSGGNTVLTNPCPNILYFTGTGGTVNLPPLNAANSLQANQNNCILIYNSATGIVTINNSNNTNTVLVINPNETWFIAPTSNSANPPAGTWQEFPLSVINVVNSPLVLTNSSISIQQANSTQNGYLSSTDWNAFNSKSNNIQTNLVYVWGGGGVDSPGNGTIGSPYATLHYAESQITTAADGNTFTIIIMGGSINESSAIQKKPYINWASDSLNTTISSGIAITPDSTTWTANPTGYFSIEGLTFNAPVLFDFTGLTGAYNPVISISNCVFNGNFHTYCNSSSLGTLNIYNTLITNSLSVINFNVNSVGNNYSILHFGLNLILATQSMLFNSFSDTIGLYQSYAANSGGALVKGYILAANLVQTPPDLHGVNCSISIDASSLNGMIPTLNTGATYSLIDFANNINSGITPAHFTPVDSTVLGALEGIDNALGTKQNTISLANVDTGSANSTGMNLLSGSQLSLTSATSSFPGVMTATGSQIIGGNKQFVGTCTASNLSGTNYGDFTISTVFNAPNSTGMFLTAGNTSTPANLALTPADSNNPGIMTSGGSQIIGGNKQFIGTCTASNLAGTNYGDFTTSSVDSSSPNSTGMLVTPGNSTTPANLQLEAASGSNPGVLTAGTQTIGGDKTFNGAVKLSSFSGSLVLQSNSVSKSIEESGVTGASLSSINQTSHQVCYGNGSLGITSSSNLTFDGNTLTLTTTTGGLEIPSMTTSQRTAQTPTKPRMVYDSTLNQYFGWNTGSSSWVILG